VITGPIGVSVESELRYAKRKDKLTVPIVGRDVEDGALFGELPHAIRPFPGGSQEQIQAAITEFLQQHNVNKNLERIIRPLVGIGLALLSEPS
jgi:hypothetical protein